MYRGLFCLFFIFVLYSDLNIILSEIKVVVINYKVKMESKLRENF